MFSNKKLLSVLAGAGLALGASACSDSSGSLNFLCEAAYECAYGTFSYEYAGGVDGGDAGDAADADVLDDLAAASLCLELLGGDGSAEADAVEGCEPTQEFAGDVADYLFDSCEVTVEVDETEIDATIEATVDIYGNETDPSEGMNYVDCAELEDDLGITAE